jgi:endonuclease/exonuclease/phosphatase family metal-dependent hydrolase
MRKPFTRGERRPPPGSAISPLETSGFSHFPQTVRSINDRMRRKFLIGSLILMLLALGTGCTSGLFFLCRPAGAFVAAASVLPETSPVTLRVLSWNVLQSKSLLLAAPWAQRQESFRLLLGAAAFDVICLQEALPDQVAFFSTLLPGFAKYGVGRDDGKDKGEHCPIFFNTEKYTLRDSGTFWLSPTPEKPSSGWGESVPRVCSWVELEDTSSRGRFRVYNLHMQLHPLAQPKSARAIRDHMKNVAVPAVIVGDFNAPHGSPALRILKQAGYTDAESSSALTYHLKGRALRCLDHILTDENWHVAAGGILKEKGGKVFPSDHFGLWAELKMR